MPKKQPNNEQESIIILASLVLGIFLYRYKTQIENIKQNLFSLKTLLIVFAILLLIFIPVYFIYRHFKLKKEKLKARTDHNNYIELEKSEIKKTLDKRLPFYPNELEEMIEELKRHIEPVSKNKELYEFKPRVLLKIKVLKQKIEDFRQREIGQIKAQKRKEEKERREIKNREVIDIKVDYSRGIFRKERLNKHDINYLEHHGYVDFKGKSLTTNKIDRFMIKPRFNESFNHAFTSYQLFYFIKKFTPNVKMYETHMPDIVFKFNRAEYAIEIETGIALKYHKKLLLKKAENLNKNYGQNWFFVVTNRRLASKYSKLGFPTTDKRYVLNKIMKIFENPGKPLKF